jgi:hypothetical protein
MMRGLFYSTPCTKISERTWYRRRDELVKEEGLLVQDANVQTTKPRQLPLMSELARPAKGLPVVPEDKWPERWPGDNATIRKAAGDGGGTNAIMGTASGDDTSTLNAACSTDNDPNEDEVDDFDLNSFWEWTTGFSHANVAPPTLPSGGQRGKFKQVRPCLPSLFSRSACLLAPARSAYSARPLCWSFVCVCFRCLRF